MAECFPFVLRSARARAIGSESSSGAWFCCDPFWGEPFSGDATSKTLFPTLSWKLARGSTGSGLPEARPDGPAEGLTGLTCLVGLGCFGGLTGLGGLICLGGLTGLGGLICLGGLTGLGGLTCLGGLMTCLGGITCFGGLISFVGLICFVGESQPPRDADWGETTACGETTCCEPMAGLSLSWRLLRRKGLLLKKALFFLGDLSSPELGIGALFVGFTTDFLVGVSSTLEIEVEFETSL